MSKLAELDAELEALAKQLRKELDKSIEAGNPILVVKNLRARIIKHIRTSVQTQDPAKKVYIPTSHIDLYLEDLNDLINRKDHGMWFCQYEPSYHIFGLCKQVNDLIEDSKAGYDVPGIFNIDLKS